MKIIFIIQVVQSDYPSQLALALSLSLIVTIICLGGALAGFLYWRKLKFRAPSARSAHTNPVDLISLFYLI